MVLKGLECNLEPGLIPFVGIVVHIYAVNFWFKHPYVFCTCTIEKYKYKKLVSGYLLIELVLFFSYKVQICCCNAYKKLMVHEDFVRADILF